MKYNDMSPRKESEMSTELKIERDGSGAVLRLHDTSRYVECTPEDASYIGRRLDLFLNIHLDALSDAAMKIQDVLELSRNYQHIAIARGQIEDALGDTSRWRDLAIAIMDVHARDSLADAAREVDDPFTADDGQGWARTISVPFSDLRRMFEGYIIT